VLGLCARERERRLLVRALRVDQAQRVGLARVVADPLDAQRLVRRVVERALRVGRLAVVSERGEQIGDLAEALVHGLLVGRERRVVGGDRGAPLRAQRAAAEDRLDRLGADRPRRGGSAEQRGRW
jgi:hypothetical protein